ncbi:hypothetical protein [Polymorphospora rubra]|uniref:hypothetical protein n=1 Tax=Polymorphospora rubra TaxID=338584 RepID=UPI001BB3F9D1|nr:hypothetical protein [Polymorphospora rubra]
MHGLGRRTRRGAATTGTARSAAAVPRRLHEIRLHHPAPDTGLARAYGGGIRITADNDHGTCTAVAPDGVVLAEILDPTFSDFAA